MSSYELAVALCTELSLGMVEQYSYNKETNNHNDFLWKAAQLALCKVNRDTFMQTLTPYMQTLTPYELIKPVKISCIKTRKGKTISSKVVKYE